MRKLILILGLLLVVATVQGQDSDYFTESYKYVGFKDGKHFKTNTFVEFNPYHSNDIIVRMEGYPSIRYQSISKVTEENGIQSIRVYNEAKDTEYIIGLDEDSNLIIFDPATEDVYFFTNIEPKPTYTRF